MRRVLELISVALLVAGIFAAAPIGRAQEATPAPLALPEATAPDGLGRIVLPADETAIVDLFARMPATVAGQTRAPEPTLAADRVVLAYGQVDPAFGPPLYLQAIDFTRNDFFPPDFTAGLYIATVAAIPDFGALAHGRDGAVAWVVASSRAGVAGDNPATPVIERPIYTLTWGELDSRWLFSAAASTPEELEALVIAFVLTSTAPPAA